jgi:hypothetical protein
MSNYFNQDEYYDGSDLDGHLPGGSDLDAEPLSKQAEEAMMVEGGWAVRAIPKPYLTPERRAYEHGFSHTEMITVGRWLGLLLDECPTPDDALSFWRSCQIIRWMAEPLETQRQLAARIEKSQPWVCKLVIKISQKLSQISAF